MFFKFYKFVILLYFSIYEEATTTKHWSIVNLKANQQE